MKLKMTVLLALIFILILPNFAYADVIEDLENEVTDNINNIDFSKVDDVAFDFIGSVAGKVQSIINGEYDSAESFLQLLLALLTSGLKALLPELSVIFVVIVILGLIRKTSGGMISQSTDEVVSFVGVTVVIVSTLSLIVKAYKDVYQVLFQVSALADATMPIMLTLLIANGGNVASSVCQPSMVMFSGVIIKLTQRVILPLSVFALVFALVGNISSNVKVGKMSSFLNNISGWVLGVVFMLYSAFTSVQGISAMAIDGVSFRAAKFATKSYIPILGGYLSDGFDIVIASTSLIKNAFGVVSLLTLVFTVAQPLMSVLCINLGLQAIAAFCEPIIDDRYIKILNGISKTLTFLAVLILAVAFMFCILTLVAICCANGV